MYKMIFFDVDGTLLTSNHDISESTSRSLDELRHNKVIVAIASGRTPFNIGRILEATGIQTYIIYNGGLVMNNGEVLNRTLLEQDKVRAFMNMALKNQDSLILDEEQSFSVHGNDVERIRTSFLPGWELRCESSDYDTASVFQIELFCSDKDVLNYQKAFPNLAFYPWMSKRNAFNVIPKNLSKVNGIKTLLQFYDIDKSESMAFGDGENDVEMLAFVGMGVAMGNASQHVKAQADFVTRHVNDDGIRIGLKKLQMI